jgi:hypothetical protein
MLSDFVVATNGLQVDNLLLRKYKKLSSNYLETLLYIRRKGKCHKTSTEINNHDIHGAGSVIVNSSWVCISHAH